LLALPGAVAAAEPTLTATPIPGKEIDVVGAGFPADADVLLTIQRNGTDDGSQDLRTDSTGAFTATIDAGPGRGGVYTLTATSGSVTATVEAVAVETAGGLGPSPSSQPPATDTVVGPAGQSNSPGEGQIAVLALIGGIGLGVAMARLRGRPTRT
jgi:hypothetical protein